METIKFVINTFGLLIEKYPVGGTISTIIVVLLALSLIYSLLSGFFKVLDFGFRMKKETSGVIFKMHVEGGIDSLRGKTPDNFILTIKMLDCEVIMIVVEDDYLALTENLELDVVYIMGRISRKIDIKKLSIK